MQMVTALRYGTKRPYAVMRAADATHLPFNVACALLEKESAGGANVFGHDPTIYVGAGRVTKKKYLAYRRERDRTGKMQGVGPCQLTWKGYQDEADKLGGCWKPYNNMLVGFRLLKSLRDSQGSWTAAGTRYNGASSYGHDLKVRIDKWHKRLS